MRIAYLCQYFVPEPAAPAARVHELSRAWVEAGNHVTVVTAFPNHPTGEVPPGYRGRAAVEERLDGIRVLRSWLFARPNRGVSNRGLSQVTFMASAALLSLPRLGPVDVVIASSPPLFSALSAWLMARLRRVPFVLEVRDLWPDAFVEIGVMRAGLRVRALAGMARFLYQQAARVVVVTEAFAERLEAQGVPAAKLAVISNGADLRLFAPGVDGAGTRDTLGIAPGRFVAAYVGSHGVSQGLDVVIDAAVHQPEVTYVLVGDGSEKQRLEERVTRLGLRNVIMRPSVLKAGVPRLYATADVCLVPLRDVPIFETFVPSKLFELLAAGRPIVAAVRGEARSILDRSGAALLVDPGDAEGMANAVERLRHDPALRVEMGRRGRAFAEEHFNRDRLAERYLGLLANVVTTRGHRLR